MVNRNRSRSKAVNGYPQANVFPANHRN